MPTSRPKFILAQLEKGSTTEQAWQFLGAALRTYCPDKLPVLSRWRGSRRRGPAAAPEGPPLAAEQPQ